MFRSLARNRILSTSIRLNSTLVVAEHDNGALNAATLNAITAAAALKQDVNCLVAGSGVSKVVDEVKAVAGVKKVFVADSEQLKGFLAEKLTPLLQKIQVNVFLTHPVLKSSSFDAPCISNSCFDVPCSSSLTSIVCIVALLVVMTHPVLSCNVVLTHPVLMHHVYYK